MQIISNGQKKVINKVLSIIGDNDAESHIIYLVGKGGTGKTTILNKLLESINNDSQCNYLVLKYDYRDLYAQSIIGIHLMVADEISKHLPALFQDVDYIELFSALSTLSDAGNGITEFQLWLREKLEKIKLSNTRIIIFEDTLDTIENAGLQYISSAFSIGAMIPNCVAIIGTRDEEHTRKYIDSIDSLLMADSVVKWNKHVFNLDNEFKYQQEDAIHFLNTTVLDPLDDSHMAKISLLSNLNPCILSIFSECYNRGYKKIIPPDLTISENGLVEYLQTQDGLKTIDEFNSNLLNFVKDLATPYSWAILYLSHLRHRYKSDLLSILLEDISKEEFDDIENKLKHFLFMRPGIIKNNEFLHDELIDLINKYVWPSIDTFFVLRNSITLKAVQMYYDLEIASQKSNFLTKSSYASFEDLILFWNSLIDLASNQIEKLHYIDNLVENNFLTADQINELSVFARNDIIETINMLCTLPPSYYITRGIIISIYKNGVDNIGTQSGFLDVLN
jgi:hypothetical protein